MTHKQTVSQKIQALLLFSFVLFPAINFAAGIENWPNYRGPTKDGHADEAKLPLRWSEEENVTWKTAIKGKAWSSPVVWGDRIFLTNAPEDGSSLSVVCVDKNTGKVLYNKRLLTIALPQYCHPFNSYASCSPVVEEDRLYVSFGSPYNGCLDMETGEVIWERTDFVCNHFRGPGSSPLIYGNSLILHFDGSDQQYVVAVDKNTGKTLWRTDRTVDFQDIDPSTGKIQREGDWRKAFSTPLVVESDGQATLVSLGSMALYGYDPADGKELWRIDFIEGHSGACRPIFEHGLIYFQTGGGYELWTIRPGGKGVLGDEAIVWRHKRVAVPRRSSFVIVDDSIYMVDDSGVAACLDALTGEVVWKKRLGSNFSSSLIHADGRIYFFDQEGKTTVIKASRKYEVLVENELDEGFMASPAVSGNALFVRTRTHLYRIEDSKD
ncbi:MAG: PQQ-like beta-propeller repeat protein [Planctomycetes bacterium]|nr:PQQ-like beta-propeller repeat protein [Planctomycetota bacterium]